uniref:Glycylpeptide N-tetradecanoyltransferase n=1 Tax=viral metagenome TaxID=1070528 RepID=A0A6C0CNH7_9ZZZZ
MREYLLYVLYIIFILYVIALIAAKIHSPFWFHQPVYHPYEIYPRWCTIPYCKRKLLPKLGIFCKPDQIISYSWNNCSDEIMNKIVELLQGHYVDNNSHLFHMDIDKFQKCLKMDTSSMLSVFHDFHLKEPTFQKCLDKSKIWGSITSRPIDLFFLKFSQKNTQIHFWDFICVNGNYKSKTLSRNLIQTHIFNHLRIDPTFSGIYLFKKEVELCKGIVPLIETKVYTFLLKPTPIQKLPQYYSVRCLNKTHVHLWNAIYAEMTTQFEICCLANTATSLEWLENERYTIWICVLKENKVEHIHGVYILENTFISWDNDNIERKSMVRLAGSMIFRKEYPYDMDNLYFFKGFLHSLKNYLYDQKQYGVLEIPNISHNRHILKRWHEKYELKNETDIAYYLYNMVYPKSPINSNNIIIIG